MKQTDEAVYKKKLLELASRANGSGRCTFTPFLGLAGQNILRCAEKELSGVIRTEFGGADGCERIMVRFGDPKDCGYACPFPIRCIRAIPRSKKFAEQLTHRDILGSLMALGIDRNRTGDIAVRENEIYIFCTEQIAPYIAENFVSARRTDLSCDILPLPDTMEENGSPAPLLPPGLLFTLRTVQCNVASERLDAVAAQVFRLSRGGELPDLLRSGNPETLFPSEGAEGSFTAALNAKQKNPVFLLKRRFTADSAVLRLCISMPKICIIPAGCAECLHSGRVYVIIPL